MQQVVILITLLAVNLEENEISMMPEMKGTLLLAVLLAVKLKACWLGVKLESLVVPGDIVFVL